jgi:rhodanese-related sulfurtransferase
MDRLLEYFSKHSLLAVTALVALSAALGYELWLRAQSLGALSPQEAIRLMNQGATVLDLRAPEAFAAGHIAGARNFDATQLPGAAESLKKNKERALILYCDHGNTAAQAVRFQFARGYRGLAH